MTQEELANLYSDHRLSSSTLDFLELLKNYEFQIDYPEKFQLINLVNRNNQSIKKILNSYYEVGFTNTYNLNNPSVSNEISNFKKINSNRTSTRKYDENPLNFQQLSDFLSNFYFACFNKIV